MGEENIYNNSSNTTDSINTSDSVNINPKYPNAQYMVPFGSGVYSHEQEKTMQSNGGKASQEARKKRKTFQEMAQAILAVQCSKEMVSESLGAYAGSVFPEGKQPTMAELILARQSVEAANGNGKSAEYVRDSAGYKPTQAVSIEGMDDASRELLDRVAKRLEREAGKAEKG